MNLPTFVKSAREVLTTKKSALLFHVSFEKGDVWALATDSEERTCPESSMLLPLIAANLTFEVSHLCADNLA